MGDTIKLTERWCLVQDGSRVVPETDPDARWLHWVEGEEVELQEAVRLGAVQGKRKMRPALANKMAKSPANKGGY